MTQLSTKRHLPVLLLLFVGSGCAALIYEIVWFQLLQLVIGSNAISLGVLLGTFMGGMCLGSLLLPRFMRPGRHPLRVYALIEAGIALFALFVLYGMPEASRLYAIVGGAGLGGIFMRATICVVFLLPPTLLMGATLPAMARWLETDRQGVSWLGFFYGGNIAGAVSGCLLAGFYLLRVHDMATSTFVAVAINLAVGALGYALARRTTHTIPAADSPRVRTLQTPGARAAYIAIGLSGLTALGSEVVWTRILSLTFGASVYSFSIILAVFLIGLGIGSSVGSVLARRVANPRVALAICQLLLTAALAWAALMLTQSLPYWPINPSLSGSPWFIFQLDFVRCAWAILPGPLLWGASFPLAVAAVAAPGQDPARLVGSTYAANTVGAIFGALLFSVLLIPGIGTQDSQRTLIAVALVSGIIALSPALAGRSMRTRAALIAVPVVVAALVVLLISSVQPIPGVLAAYGRYSPTYGPPNVLYLGEGMNSTVAVTELPSGVRNFHVSGKVEASTEAQDMRLQRMLGHISALLHPAPKSVLIVGFGAGVTAGSFVLHPGVERIVICEIEPLIPRVVSTYFSNENYDVLHDPRVTVVYDDARHYILTSKEKFDVITSDPINPWVKGAATLYTREYFELAKRHLNPGGVITQWVPLYESDFGVVKSELATFFDAFPQGTVWSNDMSGRGYDVLLAGTMAPAPIDVDAWRSRLARPDHARVMQSLRDVGFTSSMALLATYGGYGPDLQPWAADAEINRDRNLRLQYLAGFGSYLYRSAAIYEEMQQYRRFPGEVFTGSLASMLELRLLLGVQPSPDPP